MIRKIYLDIIREKLAGGNLLWGARAGSRYLLTRLSKAAGKPLCGPILGTVIVTYRCNYDCAMCDMPSKAAAGQQKGTKELDTGDMINIIDQLALLGVMGIGFTGGEPMLRKDIFDLLEHSKKRGLLTHLNTNGSLLTRDVISGLMATGLDSLNISLDAANAPVHNAIRGVEGSWETAVQAARDVVSLKGSGMPRLKIVMVVGTGNLEEVPGMVDVAADLGVECLEYIPEQLFSGKKITGSTEENCLAQRAGELLDKAVTSARGRVRIENSPRMLELFAPALGGKPSPLNCFAAYNTITIDCYGQVFPCLPWANWERSPQELGNDDLKELWQATAYGSIRKEAVLCRQCTLNCLAELNLLFQPLKRVSRR